MTDEHKDNDVQASLEAMLDAYLVKLMYRAIRGEIEITAAQIAQVNKRLNKGTVTRDEIDDPTAGRVIDKLRELNWKFEGDDLPPLDELGDDQATA